MWRTEKYVRYNPKSLRAAITSRGFGRKQLEKFIVVFLRLNPGKIMAFVSLSYPFPHTSSLSFWNYLSETSNGIDYLSLLFYLFINVTVGYWVYLSIYLFHSFIHQVELALFHQLSVEINIVYFTDEYRLHYFQMIIYGPM